MYVHTVEYYLALKRKETLTHATERMNLQDIILSEISQLLAERQIMYESTYLRHVESQIHRNRQ